MGNVPYCEKGGLFLDKILKKLDICIEVIGCVAFALMIVFTMGNVLSDWTIGKRFAQLDEIVQSFFVWVTYVGMGVLYKNGEQMHVDFLVNLLPEKLRKVNDVFVDLFTLGISCIMFYQSWLLAAKSMNKTTAVMRIPYTLIDFALVIGFFTLSLYIVVRLIWMVRNGGKENG